MIEQEIELLIKEGEGYRLEFKRELSNIDKAISAFANAGGGTILLGIEDDGSVYGVIHANKVKAELLSTARNCDPGIPIDITKSGYKGKEVLIVKVEEGKDKPYHCKDGFFMRVGASSQKMNRNELVKLVRSLNSPTFDSLPCEGFDMKKHFDAGRFRRYAEKAGLKGKTAKILESIGVIKDGKMNNAGVLFFAKDPQKFFMQSCYFGLLSPGTTKAEIIDRKEIKGGLFEIVEQVEKFVEFNARTAFRFTGKLKRENIKEYPLKAVREGIVNSVIHKYYPEPGHNNILTVYSDRLHIENYWIKPDNYKVGETVFRRNPIIADLMDRIDYGERAGSGFLRMREDCKLNNAPNPKAEAIDNYFYLTFGKSREYVKATGLTPPVTPPVTPPRRGTAYRVGGKGVYAHSCKSEDFCGRNSRTIGYEKGYGKRIYK